MEEETIPTEELKDRYSENLIQSQFDQLHFCSRCVYHDRVPAITFDEEGVCNYCRIHDSMEAQYPMGEEGEERLMNLIKEIKEKGKRKKYDCVVGVSGGCDSSYMLYKMKEYGLRPLAVHFDNTWNSSIATQNIHKVLKELDIDLYTLVVDNEEYDDIYRSFLKAGVPDIEAPTDIGLATTLYKAAEKHGIKYMIEGHSFRTEGISPLGWLYMDGKYISDVHKKHGTKKMKTFPNLWLWSFFKWMVFSKIKKVRPLYYMNYQKENTKEFLSEEFGWQWYGGHHLENRFTAFYHTFFLPRRFGIDTRIMGYSALIRSGQMTREEGMELFRTPPEVDGELIDYVQKRLGLSDEEFHHYMTMPKKTFRDYKSYKPLFEKYSGFFKAMYKADLVPYSFYKKYCSTDNI